MFLNMVMVVKTWLLDSKGANGTIGGTALA
jgi:hypothetical protein